jgi:hypothetical protein
VKRQHGATLTVLVVLIASALAVAATVIVQRASSREPARLDEARNLALAADALRGFAFARRCVDTSVPLPDLLPCPDAAATEGVSASICPGLTQGWLPWRTLGLPPLRDTSGTCLWYERQGITARIVAAGGASAGQNRAPLAGRATCGGNLTATNYMDAADPSLAIALNATLLTTRCP